MSDYVESGWGFLNDSPGSSSGSSNDSPGSSNDSSGSYAYGDDVSGVDFWNPSSESSGSNNNNNSGWGNDPGGEFGGSPTVIQESEDDYYEDDGYWDPPAGTDPPINYVPWQTSNIDNYVSAFGGLTYDWVDPNSAFLTEDIWGNPLPDHGEHWYTGGGLWNPFYAGENPITGEPIWLNEGQFNDMMTFGEFGSPYGGNTTSGGSSGGSSGGWYSGRGGSGRGGGGSRMQVAGAGGDGHIWPRWGPFTQQGDYIRNLRRANRGGIVSLC